MNGELVRRLFAPICLVALVMVLLAAWWDRQREWKDYQREYYRQAGSKATDPVRRDRILATPLRIRQIQTRLGGKVDRCITCHAGVDNPNLTDAPQPFRTHPGLERLGEVLGHRLDEFGCTCCHDGQGLATTMRGAHGAPGLPGRPLLAGKWLEIGCGRCHKGVLDLEGAPVLSRGRRLAKRVGCYNCHKMEGFGEEEPGSFGPALDRLGEKVRKEWLKEWLKDPFAFKARTRMLKFYLSDEEAGALAGFLLGLKGGGTVEAALKSTDPEVQEGRKLFHDLKCFFCHKMEGFEKKEMAPDLTGFGLKNVLDLDFGRVKDVEPTLRAWTMRKIRDPRAYETKETKLTMPGNDLGEDDVAALTVLLLSFTGGEVPVAYRRAETYGGEGGRRLFDELHCIGCHNVRSKGLMGENLENVARDLSDIGSKTRVVWMFRWLRDPASIYPNTRMPTVGHLGEDSALALTHYVMGFRENDTGEPQGGRTTLREGGGIDRREILEGRKVYESMECYRCHRIAGRGGGIAPELTRIGEKVREEWLLKWLSRPENYNLNMLDDRTVVLSDRQVRMLASYLLSLRGDKDRLVLPRVPRGALLINEEPTDDQADPVERARRLFGEAGPVQYLFGKRVGRMGLGCYGCHRLGDQGSDIGPDLSEEGSKVTRDWLLRWLEDPRSYMPGTKMGDFHLTEQEARELTDYLMRFRVRPAPEGIAASGGSGSTS